MLPARQYPGEVAYRLLMLLVPDLGKVAGDLEQHSLMRCDLPRAFLPHAFIKISDRGAQHAGNLKKSPRGDAIDAVLIFMSLLIAYPDHFAELLLGQAQQYAPFADPPADMIVDRGG